jgi:hypothetical protein
LAPVYSRAHDTNPTTTRRAAPAWTPQCLVALALLLLPWVAAAFDFDDVAREAACNPCPAPPAGA